MHYSISDHWIKKVILQHRGWRRNHPDPLIKECRKQKNNNKLIELASLSRYKSGKKHPHQRRINNDSLKKFSRSLIKRKRAIIKSRSFSLLLCILKSARKKGIGELTIYDTALRIGISKNIKPNEVYLHAGTKKGAQILLKSRIRTDSLTISELPTSFHALSVSCVHAEEILCIYKDALKNSKACEKFLKNKKNNTCLKTEDEGC